MYYRVINATFAAAGDVGVDLPGNLLSVTVVPQTSSVDVSVRPGQQSDFLLLSAGRTATFELAGQLIQMPQLTLRAAAAVTVAVVVGYP